MPFPSKELYNCDVHEIDYLLNKLLYVVAMYCFGWKLLKVLYEFMRLHTKLGYYIVKIGLIEQLCHNISIVVL